MSASLPKSDETTRKLEAQLLRSLAEVGQVEVSARMGVSESTLSRMKGEDLQRIASLVSALGLKLVRTDALTVDRADFIAVKRMARNWLDADLASLGEEL
ncbi:CII family transcriptional regulator [Silvimonas soli]|uniref:CII family transcriptional regulator n=1 Tax=Silvimonas soli TaxID=2980100 RepID=UPI0024B3C60E|nr:CII family transcriptional regulator [Silvimonas soli]